MESKEVLSKLLEWVSDHNQVREDIINHIGCNENDLDSLYNCIVTSGDILDGYIHFNYYSNGTCQQVGSANVIMQLNAIFELLDSFKGKGIELLDIVGMYLEFKEDVDYEDVGENSCAN